MACVPGLDCAVAAAGSDSGLSPAWGRRRGRDDNGAPRVSGTGRGGGWLRRAGAAAGPASWVAGAVKAAAAC
jgi:hypothetical protein